MVSGFLTFVSMHIEWHLLTGMEHRVVTVCEHSFTYVLALNGAWTAFRFAVSKLSLGGTIFGVLKVKIFFLFFLVFQDMVSLCVALAVLELNLDQAGLRT